MAASYSWYKDFIVTFNQTMNHILQHIFFPSRLDFRRQIRNRAEIVRFLTSNKGTGAIFGIYKCHTPQMFFVSVAYLGSDDNREFAELHCYDPSGEYMSNIRVFVDTIDAVCPFDNLPRGINMLTKYFQDQIASLIPSKWALAA